MPEQYPSISKFIRAQMPNVMLVESAAIIGAAGLNSLVTLMLQQSDWGMNLVAGMHAEAVNILERGVLPFDKLTPELNQAVIQHIKVIPPENFFHETAIAMTIFGVGMMLASEIIRARQKNNV